MDGPNCSNDSSNLEILWRKMRRALIKPTWLMKPSNWRNNLNDWEYRVVSLRHKSLIFENAILKNSHYSTVLNYERTLGSFTQSFWESCVHSFELDQKTNCERIQSGTKAEFRQANVRIPILIGYIGNKFKLLDECNYSTVKPIQYRCWY